jgi:hypothetical protein
MRTQAVILLALLFALMPAEALAKPKQARGPAVDAVRLTPYVGAAGGGRVVERGPRFDDYWTGGMRGGGQVGARLEVPVNPYFALGGLAEFGGTAARGARRHDLHLDFSFWAKGRYVLDLKPFDLELYAGVPIGMSLAFQDYWDGPGRDFGGGLNSGLLFGAQFLFKRGGFFTDLGPRFRRTWYGDGWSWGTRQFNMNFGGVIFF